MRIKDMSGIEELYIELVKDGLKPATDISISQSCNLSFIDDVLRITCPEGPAIFDSYFSQLDFQILEGYLKYHGMVYCTKESSVNRRAKQSGNIVKEHRREVLIAKNLENLERLVQAKDDTELGEAYGYPLCCSRYFSDLKSDHNEGFKQIKILHDSFNIEKEIPLWHSYVYFIACKFDSSTQVCPKYKELGERYQTYAREKFPKLADRIESDYMRYISINFIKQSAQKI